MYTFKNTLDNSEEWISLNLYEIRKPRENILYLIRKMGITPDIYKLIDIYRFSHRSNEDILYIYRYNCKVEKIDVSDSDGIQKSLNFLYNQKDREYPRPFLLSAVR